MLLGHNQKLVLFHIFRLEREIHVISCFQVIKKNDHIHVSTL